MCKQELVVKFTCGPFLANDLMKHLNDIYNQVGGQEIMAQFNGRTKTDRTKFMLSWMFELVEFDLLNFDGPAHSVRLLQMNRRCEIA